MPLSIKQSLINYLEFLKESGILYIEGLDSPPFTPSTPSTPPAPSTPSTPSTASMSSMSSTPSKNPQSAIRNPQSPPPVLPVSPVSLVPPGPLSREERLALLADGARRAQACRACALGSQRIQAVYYDGDPLAQIVFVGEAPGANEDQQGKPFVGAAGQLLNRMIAAIGFKREEVFICNTLKCRPPQNRDPLPGEKAACEHFLLEQLQIVRPRIVVALGAHAAHYLCRSEDPIGRLRGRWHAYNGIPLRVTYHPSYLLKQQGTPDERKFKMLSWDDFQAIHAKYCELNPADRRELWTKKEKSE